MDLIQLGKATEKVATALKEKTGGPASPGERKTGVSHLLGEHSSCRWAGLVLHYVLLCGSALAALST